MAKFFKKIKGIEISDLTQKEIFSLLKINCTMMFTFKKNEQIIDYIVLDERTFSGNINMIKISTLNKPNLHLSTYDNVLNIIGENASLGILSVEIDKKDFQLKEPLLVNIDKLNQSIINSCVFIDYDIKKQIYNIVNRPSNNISNKLYYFELNDSLLLFNNEGPSLIYGKTTGIGDILYKK